ncbi:hypothetical protein SRABI106_03211 [Rahnella aquatilis]|nr:hypothetical protein SRABI106_03211 [Rahnella aquatilis]
MAPAPAASNGAKRRSHNCTSLLVPRVCEKISAAATGVPNNAPIDPAAARITQSVVGTAGNKRDPIAATSAILITVIGCSGPRLTPPASPTISASASPGKALTATGAPIRDSVAGSGPAWPGIYLMMAPTPMPVSVSINSVQLADCVLIFSTAGMFSHSRFCSAPEIIMTNTRTRLDITPIMIAGRAKANMTLVRGWNMHVFPYFIILFALIA